MGSVGKKITDDILGFDDNRFLGFKKKNIANAAGKVMTPGQIKTAGKIAKVAAPVMAFTPVGKMAGAAIKKGGKGIGSVVKSVGGGAGSAVGKGLSSAGSLVGKGMSGAGKLLGRTPASQVTKVAKTAVKPISKLTKSTPIYGRGVSKAAKAADMLKRMKIAGEVANPTGTKIPLPRGGFASVGGKLAPARESVRKKVQKAGIKTKGVLALFLDLPFV